MQRRIELMGSLQGAESRYAIKKLWWSSCSNTWKAMLGRNHHINTVRLWVYGHGVAFFVAVSQSSIIWVTLLL
jgi:hypothetical protein